MIKIIKDKLDVEQNKYLNAIVKFEDDYYKCDCVVLDNTIQLGSGVRIVDKELGERIYENVGNPILYILEHDVDVSIDLNSLMRYKEYR